MDYQGLKPLKTVAKPLELFKKAQQQNDPFDVIIMDLTVPGGMGAGKRCLFLRRLDPDGKTIVSSGYCNDPVMADCKNMALMEWIILKRIQLRNYAKK